MRYFYALACLLISNVLFAEKSVEVVATIPVETDLAVEGVPSTQAVWIEMIRSAKESIDLEQFYVSEEEGEALTPVLEAIEGAAKRGVKVRLILDYQFHKIYPQIEKKWKNVQNIEVKILDLSLIDGVQHAKFFIIDKKKSFIGSANFDWRALKHIHEIGLKITDTNVARELAEVFEKDWAGSDEVPPYIKLPSAANTLPPFYLEKDKTIVVSPYVGGSDVAPTIAAIISLLKNAKRSVQIMLMEYSTKPRKGREKWTLLERALLDAAASGVKVQVLVDASNVKKAKESLKNLNVTNVEVKVATIPQYSGGPISFARLVHSKFVVVDDEISWVGSENWSKNYFFNTRNVGIVVRSSETSKTLRAVFDKVWNSQYVSAGPK